MDNRTGRGRDVLMWLLHTEDVNRDVLMWLLHTEDVNIAQDIRKECLEFQWPSAHSD